MASLAKNPAPTASATRLSVTASHVRTARSLRVDLRRFEYHVHLHCTGARSPLFDLD
jgi:hypothetical protein